MRIAIIGTGHVGLVSGACFAAKGHDVVCVDIDPQRVEAINEGRVPFFEAGLEELVSRTVPDRLRASLDLLQTVVGAEVILLAVGTPFDGHQLDLGQIREAARQVGEALKFHQGRPLILVKSTVLPGTTDGLVRETLEAASGREVGRDFSLGMNPEFLREGQAVADFMEPDRMVFGGDDRSHEIQQQLYRDFPCSDVMLTHSATAEMIKYASNSLLATLISFSNEMGNLSSTLPGVDIRQVMAGVHLDKRLAPILDRPAAAGDRIQPGILSYLEAGCGFGGSCLPKDVQSLIAFGESRGTSMDLLSSVIRINRRQPEKVVSLVLDRFSSLTEVPIAILGLAFKPGTSDIRESPALPVIRSLLQHGAQIRAYDPAAIENTRAALASEISDGLSLQFTDDLSTATEGAEVIVILTSWPELQALPALLQGRDPAPLVIDGRRMLPADSVANYAGIGLGPSSSSDPPDR